MVSKTSWWLSIEKISKLIKLSPASGENKRRYLKSPPQGNQCETHLLNCCRRLSSPYILNDFFVWAVSTNPSLTAPTTATTGAWCSLISLGTTGVQGAPFWRKTSNMDTANGRHISYKRMSNRHIFFKPFFKMYCMYNPPQPPWDNSTTESTN